MARPPLEVADLLRTLLRQNRLPRVSPAQAKVVRALVACRTAALGGHVDVCDSCGHEAVSYNSCRNRHCPKCQGAATAEWLAAQQQIVLPVEYAHVVFTLPSQLAPLALQNPRVVYGILFRAVSQTLLEVAATPRHLGARIGFLAILHTWGQNLMHHPHLHCVVPAGGISAGNGGWVKCRPGFFLPVRVLARLYRGKLLAFLTEAHAGGHLQFHGELQRLARPGAFHGLMAEMRRVDWVVFAKPPFGGADAVIKYLARYTHRVAISNHRLVTVDEHHVSLRWKDYRRGHRQRVMRLEVAEFARRFLLHVLPRGFVKIRYYGYLAQSRRTAELARCRSLLDAAPVAAPAADAVTDTSALDTPERSCPACHRGTLKYDRILKPPDTS